MKAAALLASACLAVLAPASAWACGNSMNVHRKAPVHVADAFEKALNEANAALTRGDYEKAKHRAQFATSSPDEAIVHRANRTLGLAALQLGEFELASRALEIVHKVVPTPLITATLGEAELGAGRVDRASTLLEQLATDEQMPDADGFVALARVRLAKANKEGALAAVGHALSLSANHKAALALKAELEGEAPPATEPAKPAPTTKRTPKRAVRS